MKTTPVGGQESFFIVNPASGNLLVAEQAQVRDQDSAISIVERNVHMLAVLAILGEVSQYTGFQKAVHGARRIEWAQKYGEPTINAMAAGVINNAKTATREAKWEFARASGMFALIDSGLLEAPEAKAHTAGLFEQFLRVYSGPRGAVERSKLQRVLFKNLGDIQAAVTQKNHQEGKRPHKPSEKPNESPEQGKVLGTRDRMLVLKQDPRAGFYPVTHREKNTVLAYLDYLDNPQYTLGVNSQRLEIFNHQERLKKSTGQQVSGARALQSLTYELIDYLHDSKQQLDALLQLQMAIGDFVNPNVTLLDELPDGHPGLLPLLRYKDIDLYARGKAGRTYVDPLVTKEQRWATANHPGKHKLVHGVYVASQDNEQQAQHTQAIGNVLIKKARPLLKAAVSDQMARYVFLAARVAEAAQLPGTTTLSAARDLALLTINSFGLQYTLNA